MHFFGKKVDRKSVLWGLFVFQLCLIAIFIVFGSVSDQPPDDSTAVQFMRTVEMSPSSQHTRHRYKTEAWNRKDSIVLSPRVGQYSREFRTSTSILNETFVCFREGTASITEDGECYCNAEWHGRDCGQPEVLWRAFMTSKTPLSLSHARQAPHSVFYIVDTTSISQTTLEIQMMELNDTVDLFVLCDEKVRSHDDDTPLTFGQMLLTQTTGFLNKFNDRLKIFEMRKCSPKMIYHRLRTSVASALRPDDIVVFSRSDEIINRRAIKYFKWYDDWPQPAKFRLKYTVYGFFWQHPESTVLGSAAVQVKVLEESFKNDPERLIYTKKTGIIAGDLNHFGGWWCQYCYQPIDIVRKLERDGLNVFQGAAANKLIDSSYVQRLISTGLFVDGKLGLHRMHRFSDKYYAPEYVTNSSWKFDNLLMNVYATYDDDDEGYEN